MTTTSRAALALIMEARDRTYEEGVIFPLPPRPRVLFPPRWGIKAEDVRNRVRQLWRARINTDAHDPRVW